MFNILPSDSLPLQVITEDNLQHLACLMAERRAHAQQIGTPSSENEMERFQASDRVVESEMCRLESMMIVTEKRDRQ